MTTANDELFSIFDARRVKAPELKGLDATANSVRGWFKNRRRMLASLRAQADRIERLEPEIRELGAQQFREAVADMRALARRDRLIDDAEDRAMALAREAAWRAL